MNFESCKGTCFGCWEFFCIECNLTYSFFSQVVLSGTSYSFLQRIGAIVVKCQNLYQFFVEINSPATMTKVI